VKDDSKDAKPSIAEVNLKRAKVAKEVASKQEPTPVSAGPVEKVIELAFNASRDKLREVTIIDRMQGRLLPQLDLMNMMWSYVFEVSEFRYDQGQYQADYDKPRPEPPNLVDEYIYRVAQWQKSVAGRNLDKAIDIALAEMETRAGDEGVGGADAWED